MKKILWTVVGLGLLGTAPPASAQQNQGLADLSIQDLLNIEVTSVSRKAQEVVHTPAAIYVITHDDIRRSGATTLPDVLRMAPGVSVAELNANTWSVTTRGFAGVHANKLLVLIDGRSIYTPSSGGVDWEMQMLPLEEIEQIEVIRGPGGSLWGANAINGVINIITKHANHIDGLGLATSVSRYEPGTLDVAYGSSVGPRAHYAVQGRYFQRSMPGAAREQLPRDDREAFFGRTRIDWGAGPDNVTVQADLAHGHGERSGQSVILTPPYQSPAIVPMRFDAGSADVTWKRAHSSRADSSLQVYFTHSARGEISEQYSTAGVELKHHRAVGERHDVVGGVEYRYIANRIDGTPLLRLTPADFRGYVATTFVQDDIAISRALSVTAGTKLGHDSIPGLQIQPSLRTLWSFSPRQSLWAGVSRVARTPNRFERGMHIIASAAPTPAGVPLIITLEGSSDRTFESIQEFETGYRARYGTVSVDVTGFAGEYFNLARLERGAATPAMELNTRVIRVPLTSIGGGHADTKGVEIATAWKPATRWEVAGNYSFLNMAFRENSSTSLASAVPVNGPTPRQQVHVRAFADLTRRLSASALVYHASALAPLGVDATTRLDLGAVLTVRRDVQILGGIRNLLHGDSVEFIDSLTRGVATPVRRNPYVDLRWGF
jgi:iron complex outermembrane receptor protein